MQNHTWISWIVLSRAWIAGEKYTNRLPFECLLAFAASDKIWCPALSTNRNSPVSMKPDLSSSQAWATCGAMERSRHKFQKPHSYTLYSQLIECYRILINIVIYLSYMWFFHVALIDSQWMCRMFTASWPRTLSDPSGGLYYQSLCSDSNHLIKALIHWGVSVLTVLPLPILAQARATSAP